MAKRVTVVVGSPRRKGNCAILARRAAEGVKQGGGKAEMVWVADLDIAPCSACGACQKSGAADCVKKDDLTRLLPELRRADALVLASPVYWFTFAAQAKLFIDRAFYALNGPEGHALKEKPMGLILAYGGGDPFDSGAVNAMRAFQDICRFIGAPLAGMVYGSANAAGEIRGLPGVLDEAFELGRKLGAG